MKPSSSESLEVLDLDGKSPELDPAYELFSRDIPPDFLEEKEFLRNRLRVRDQGAATEQDRILVQEGYTLHLIAAKQGDRLVGAIYGHLISRIGPDNRAVGFVTYIAVAKSHRRKGIASMLVRELKRRVEQDSRTLTNKPLVGMLFEIEATGKEEIKGLVVKLRARPLDIDYCQPALHRHTAFEPMQLWFQPLDPPFLPVEQAGAMTFPADFIQSMVLNLWTMEYVGPDAQGFDRASRPCILFMKSLDRRNVIGFL